MKTNGLVTSRKFDMSRTDWPQFSLRNPNTIVTQHFFPVRMLEEPSFYAKCMFGGFLACSLTHTAVVTLDVNKCRAQAHSKAGRWPSGLLPGLKRIATTEGIQGMKLGWAPSFFGYGAQGSFKFGFNEIFKEIYTQMIGKENLDSKAKKMALWAAASGSAEVIGDLALCPFEMTKVRMQVILPGQPGGIPHTLFSGLREMYIRRSETRFPYGSLVPLWGRQVPYTVIKFVGFYLTIESVYDYIKSKTGKEKNDLSVTTQLAVTFASGYWAGIFCAIATQPMDNLVSMKGIDENRMKTWGQMCVEMGLRDLFVKGLGTRVFMIGTMSALQWWIYGSVKSILGFGTY
jgi:solute carrier family 25 (mitochondrial phosphate transporter), member 3